MNRYSRNVYERAEIEIDRRRLEAESEHERREKEICDKYPEIAKQVTFLKSASSQVFGILKDGGDNYVQKIREFSEKNLKAQEETKDLLEALIGDRDYLEIPYTCPHCKDRGVVEGKRCVCFDELLRKYAAVDLTLESGMKLHDFSEFRTDVYPVSGQYGNVREYMKTVLESCRRFAENFTTESGSLIFLGRTGLGKTFLSSCIAKTVSEQGFSVVFGPVSSYLRKIENEHFGRADSDTLSLLTTCDLLLLDDLGSEFKTSFTESVIYEIINSRINSGRSTVISTNLTNDLIDKTYNERIVSRLTGCYMPVMFRGEDIRHLTRNF